MRRFSCEGWGPSLRRGAAGPAMHWLLALRLFAGLRRSATHIGASSNPRLLLASLGSAIFGRAQSPSRIPVYERESYSAAERGFFAVALNGLWEMGGRIEGASQLPSGSCLARIATTVESVMLSGG